MLWPATVNVLQRRLVHPNNLLRRVSLATFRNSPNAQILHSTKSVLSSNCPSKAKGTLFASSRTDIVLPLDIPVQTVAHTEASTESQLSSAQISRAAAQAVRLSFATGDIRNAYYIVNSLRLSLLRKNNRSLLNIPGVRSQIARFDPIVFPQFASPRLAAHALLHGLIRAGLTSKASQQAHLMMRDGIKIRSGSFDTTLSSLLSKATSSKVSATQRMDEGPAILHLRPSMVSDPCTRCAVRLLLQSHRSRQRRSQNAYQSLINACLLQGEILVGSLLFAMVVQEWRLPRLVAHLGNNCEDSEAPVEPIRESSRVCLGHRRYPVVPQAQLMHAILSSIDPTMSQEDPDFHTSLQALANLAVLLDRRQIPFPHIAPLIRALYRCPRMDDLVWIHIDRIPTQVKAYPYFHGVLKRLMASLPSTYPSQGNYSVLPPLDLNAYNTLLHYALRHRCSPALANDLMMHMTTQRQKPLQPDITTYNILLRSGTLIRRHDVVEYSLAQMRRNLDGGKGTESVEKSNIRKGVTSSQLRMALLTSRFRKALFRMDTEKLNILPKGLNVPLKADSFTLTSYLAYLTSTGQPHIVARILFRLLPELCIIDHPSWGSMSANERRNLSRLSRRACVQRAVEYGPYFFTAVLNALCKAGKTGLAERVWLLAKEAERVSWIHEFMPRSGPWCLPVHAYTSMMQCYAAEARRGLTLRGRVRGGPSTQVQSTHGDARDWTPQTKRHVRGWARFILTRNKAFSRRVCRGLAGRRMGNVLFRSMKSGGTAVYQALMNVKRVDRGKWRNVDIPTPDARFFNAALALFARNPGMRIRGARTARPYWRRRLRLARSRYASQGAFEKHWNPQLQAVTREMTAAGYVLPIALRYLFVGRWTPGTWQKDKPRQLDVQPFFFPLSQRSSPRPHAVPTVKTRGLPIPYKSRRRHYGRRPKKSIQECSDL